MIPPETPDLAGIPMRASHRPEPSYMPQVAITLSVLRAAPWEITRWPVSG